MDWQCRSPQLGSQIFMAPLILNTNFIKLESKIGCPVVSNWDSSTIHGKLQYVTGSLKLSFTHLQSLGTILEAFHFPKTVKVLSKSTPSVQICIKPQSRPNTIWLIIYKHSTHTKLCHLARCCVAFRERNSRNKKQDSSSW